ncbi:hypothetical protein SBA3_1740019 [Candidatus Sulfopaludibacter sp. SbA3]|nr:hypothetical protein SBA3_1740019 [Candidatus Sulfopaludibacter sp. SbA3]
MTPTSGLFSTSSSVHAIKRVRVEKPVERLGNADFFIPFCGAVRPQIDRRQETIVCPTGLTNFHPIGWTHCAWDKGYNSSGGLLWTKTWNCRIWTATWCRWETSAGWKKPGRLRACCAPCRFRVY